MTQNLRPLAWTEGGVGLVLSGGGAKGAYQVGVVKWLAEHGVRLSAVADTSVGALNGAVLAAAPELRSAAARLEQIWHELATAPPAEIRLTRALPTFGLSFYLSLLLAAGERSRLEGLLQGLARLMRQDHSPLGHLVRHMHPELVQDALLEELIAQYLDEGALAHGLPFYVAVFRSHGTLVDLTWAAAGASGLVETPDAEYLHVQALPRTEYRRAILASAALPLIFEAQLVGGQAYVDGGLGGWSQKQGNTPLSPLLRAAKCRTVIVTHLTDGSLWDRHAFPDACVLEIRPGTPMARKGGLADTLGFDATAIASWIEQGYRDTERCITTAVQALQRRAEGHQARAQRDAAVRRLLSQEL